MRGTNEACVDDGFQAITSLSRSLGGEVDLADVGSLLWVVLRQMIPCDAMALFVPDPEGGQNVLRYAAGAHADKLVGLRRPAQVGIAGWVATNCRSVLNAEPVFDLGYRANFAPALRSSVAVPLLDNGAVKPFIRIFVGPEDIGGLSGLETKLSERDEVAIVPAIAGGRDVPGDLRDA